ncbi:MAG TPA: hypothetical protein VFV38_19620, partial [Ktedonobacteraceae bacterium]|nr:hypothetical protein [Ktedonobacteraceae bacterium]
QATGQRGHAAGDAFAGQPVHGGTGVKRGITMERSSQTPSSAGAQEQPLSLEEFRQRLAAQVARCPRPHARYDAPLSAPRWADPRQRGEWRQSLQWVAENQRAMLQGHLDVQGTLWCWRCYHRACLVDLGARLGYPRLARSLLALQERNWLEEMCPQAERAEQVGIVGYQGRAAWLAVAVHGPSQVVADILNVFRRVSPAGQVSRDACDLSRPCLTS